MATANPPDPSIENKPGASGAHGAASRSEQHSGGSIPSVSGLSLDSGSGGTGPPAGGFQSSGVRDRYRFIRILGKGGFGTVYLAHDRILDQEVAIKVLTVQGASENELKRFIFEARTSAKLRHPGIVNIFDITHEGGRLQLVMEFYPGGSLSQILKDSGPLSLGLALNYTRQIAAALAFAHKKGIIHRDIKPANVFMAGDGIVKLGDFGIAARSESHENTMTGEVMGSPLYMSPEQTRDSKNIDGRSDLYSLGLTLYHLITGEPPRVIELERLHHVLRPLIKSTTAFELKDRPANAEEFITMIDAALAALQAAGIGHMKLGALVSQTTGTIPLVATPTPNTTAPATPTSTPPTPQTLGPTLTAPSPQPFGYAGSDDVTLTQPPPVQVVHAPPYRMMFVGFAILIIVVLGGFAAIFYSIRESQTPRGPQIAAAPTPAQAPPVREKHGKRGNDPDISQDPIPGMNGNHKSPEPAKENPPAATPEPVTSPAQTPVEEQPKPTMSPIPEKPPQRETENMRAAAIENSETSPTKAPTAEEVYNRLHPMKSDAEKAAEDSESGFGHIRRSRQAKMLAGRILELQAAQSDLERAATTAPNNALHQYRLGLVFLELAKDAKDQKKKDESEKMAAAAWERLQTVLKLDPQLKTPGVQDTNDLIKELTKINPYLLETKRVQTH